MLTLERLEELRKQPSTVPCNGCKACCKNDVVILSNKDNLDDFQWHFESTMYGTQRVLNRQEDGSCIYLTEQGCSIHGRSPDICQRMDCRVLYLIIPPEKQIKREAENPQMIHIYKAGLERLSTLKE